MHLDGMQALNLCCICGQADPALAASTGSSFAADSDAHGYRFGVEQVTGLTVYVRSSQPIASLYSRVDNAVPMSSSFSSVKCGNA